MDEILSGKQINLDLIIVKGQIKFYSGLLSKDNSDGTFNYHESLPNYVINDKIRFWINNNLQDYTGCLNLEIIDNNIIEAHLRLNGDFYLYDKTFVKELENLYLNQKWSLNYKIDKLYLFPVFVNTDLNIKKIDFKKILSLLDFYQAKSLRIDNIKSNHQKKSKARLFMYDIKDFNKGKELRDLILKLV